VCMWMYPRNFCLSHLLTHTLSHTHTHILSHTQKPSSSSSSPPSAADFFASPPVEGKDKDRILGQARAQLHVEVQTLIARLTSIHGQVKEQSTKIVAFGEWVCIHM
jgi:hypothetical protein